MSYITGDNPKFVYVILNFPPFGYQPTRADNRAGVAYRGRFPGAPFYVLSSLCNDLCQERFLKWRRLSIYFPYYWAEMVMAEMIKGRNCSGPKMNSHSDEFILKFASVSEFHRHKTDDRKMRTPFLFA